MTSFGRVLTAMVTPFNRDGEVDYAVAEELANYLVAHGSDSIVVCGTTGESPTLTWHEQHQLFQVIKGCIQGRAKVIAGTGSNSTREAIEATQTMSQIGLDGSLQVVPYYNKPTQSGLYLHFEAIAKACPDVPIILYNVPGRTSRNLEPETVAHLAELDNVVSIKEASGKVDQVSQIRRLTPPEFTIYSGDDSLTLPLLSVGCCGVVSVASHLVGQQLQQMIQAQESGQCALATQIHLQLLPLFKMLFVETNPVPVKAALRLQGWSVGEARLPLSPISSSAEHDLKHVMNELNLTGNAMASILN